MRNARRLALMAVLATLPVLAACTAAATTTATVPPTTPAPIVTTATAIPVVEHFPMVLQPQDKYLTARLEGTLGVRDGYLIINMDLILWPHGFRLDSSGGVPRVLDTEGNEIARYGQRLVMGGGSIDITWAEKLVGMDLPDWANGPDGTCWLAGGITPAAQ